MKSGKDKGVHARQTIKNLTCIDYVLSASFQFDDFHMISKMNTCKAFERVGELPFILQIFVVKLLKTKLIP